MLFFSFSIILEFLSGLLVFKTFPSYFLFGLAIISTIAFLIFLLPGRWTRYVVATTFLLVQIIITITNDILFHSTGEIFTFEKLALASGGISVLDASLINFFHVFVYVFVFVAFCVCLFLVPKFTATFKATRKQLTSICLVWIFALTGFAVGLGANFKQNGTLWINQFPSTLACESYGYYGFYAPNGIKYVSSFVSHQSISDEEFAEAEKFVQEGKILESNYMTGVSENNNLIVILAESVDIAAIDPVFTPFLYKLYFEDGLYLKNYYTENKTNMSEGLVLFGNYGDKKNLVNTPQAAEVVNQFSLPTLFKQKAESDGVDAKANYFHGLMANFYSRNLTFTAAGFDELVFADQQEEELKEYNKQNNQDYYFHCASWEFLRDSNFVEFNLEKLIPNEGRFMSAYATITTHGAYKLRDCVKPYYETLLSDETKLEQLFDFMELQGFDPRGLKEKAKNGIEPFLLYKSAMMDLDKTMQIIFERLKATNNLKNTTVVLYPDHNAYFDDLSYNLRGIFGNDVFKCNVNAYNLGAVVYDQKMIAKFKGEATYTGGAVCEDFVSVWDIYPTICNALNIKYNKNLAYGKDLFGNEKHIFMTLKDSQYIFNDKFYHYGQTYAIKDDFDEQEKLEFEQTLEKLLYSKLLHDKLYSDLNSFKKILEI